MRRNACRKTGYLKISLVDVSGRKKTYRVHRLILEAFRGPGDDLEGLHSPDPNKRNCRVSNLRWGTRQENIADIMALGNHHRKLDHHARARVMQSIRDGESPSAIARREGVSRHTIKRYKNGTLGRGHDVVNAVS